MSRTVFRNGGRWTVEWANVLPWWFFEHLSQNNWRPDTSWAKDLVRNQTGKQCVNVLEPLIGNFPEDLRPHCCLLSTVQFLYPWPRGGEHGRIEYSPRTTPCIHFVEHNGLLYEVTGGRCLYVFDAWHMEWCARKNTDWARHFNGRCDEYCRPCRIPYAPKARTA
jgi:hypothetical protein